MQAHRTCFLLCINLKLEWYLKITIFNPFRTHYQSYCHLPWFWKKQTCPQKTTHSNSAHFNPVYGGRIFLRNVGNTAENTRCYKTKIGYTITLKLSVLKAMWSEVGGVILETWSSVWFWRRFGGTYCPLPTEPVRSYKTTAIPTGLYGIIIHQLANWILTGQRNFSNDEIHIGKSSISKKKVIF